MRTALRERGAEAGERDAALKRRQALKMARSAHAFVRGSTSLFYRWLAELPESSRPPVGPSVWICGDCHLGNLGPIADAEGKVEVQIRDLDQTVIGNPAHDLIRLGLSLASAARGADLPGVTTANMLEEMIVGYQLAMEEPDAKIALPEPSAVKAVRRRAMGRRWRHLARERLDGERPTIPLGKRFWPLTAEERGELERLLDDPAVRTFALALASPDAVSIELLDAAYWVKGCSSLGKLREAAIVQTRGEKSGRRFGLIDVKQAVPSVAPAAPGARMPRDPARRVVAGARAIAPHLGERMLAAQLSGVPVFLRELKPQDLKLELEQFTRDEAVLAARYLAFVVGKAHARQLDAAARREWRGDLATRGLGNLEAPSWLWRAVVDLAALHEAAYLDHCRRYALSAG
jgi:uncharacterized protein (DUF2252 family)